MQNNREGNVGATAQGAITNEQLDIEKSSKFDEQLDEGKRVLDRLHEEYNPYRDFTSQQFQKVNDNIRQQQIEKMQVEMNDKSEYRKLDSVHEVQQEKEESIEMSKNMNKKASKVTQGCNCLKSKCSKNYCECYNQGRKCNEFCKCMGCENHSENQNRPRPSDGQNVERACFCKKSNCLKKYCECYNLGIKCTINCKCEECKNTEDCMQNQKPLILKNQIEEGKVDGRKERTQQEIEQINSKIDEITKLTPPEYQELMLTFLEYWLS